MIRRGIILAGGSGTRLDPLTRVVSKQLLPVYDKPLIYYPLSTLMLAGVREFLIITAPEYEATFLALLGKGADLGIEIDYAVQPKPEGIAQALLIGREFIGSEGVALILGDNIFYGQGLQHILRSAAGIQQGAAIFAHKVRDPARYGIIELDQDGTPLSLEEKPVHPRSNLAVPGLYFYDQQVIEVAATLTPSARGELEITDVNRWYLEQGKLRVDQLGRGFAWFDAGTPAALLEASQFVEVIERRQSLKIACLEEIAYRLKLIDQRQFRRLSDNCSNEYGDYLKAIAGQEAD